jgi:hypothetical protein
VADGTTPERRRADEAMQGVQRRIEEYHLDL